MGKCKSCGKETLGDYEYCLNCKPSPSKRRPQGGYQNRGGGRSSGPGYRPQVEFPRECVFADTFYEEDGYLKRAVNIDSAVKAARIFQQEKMTQTSIRSLFNSIKAVELRMKADKKLPLGYIRETFDTFLSHTEYQNRRKVVPDVFKQFVEAHSQSAVKSKKEFEGFVKYFTAIICRMKLK